MSACSSRPGAGWYSSRDIASRRARSATRLPARSSASPAPTRLPWMTMGPVGKAYAALVAAGELKPDPDQSRAVQALDRFAHEVAGRKASFFQRFFVKQEHPCGVYL